MRKFSKLLATLLAMVMVLGLTATAFAAEGDTKTEDEKTEDTAPAEGEEKKDEAAPAEGEEKKEEAAPAEGEEKKDEAAPAEGEEKKDEAAPAEGEDKKDEPAAAVSFSDVKEGQWHYASIMKMVAAGVVKGYEDGTFLPGNDVKWGEAMKMVVVFATKEEKDPVEGGNWASGYAAYLKEQKVLEADVDINKAITRVEMCQMLAKVLKIEASEQESTFPDTKDGYVIALVEKGIIKGNPDGTFAPDGTLTRAALCQMLASVPETGDDPVPTEPAADQKDEAGKEDETTPDTGKEDETTPDTDKKDDETTPDTGKDDETTPDSGKDE